MGNKSGKEREEEIADALRPDRRAPSMSQVALQQHLDRQQHMNQQRAVAHQRAVTQAAMDQKRLAQMRAHANAQAMAQANANAQAIAQANAHANAQANAMKAAQAQANAMKAAQAKQLAQTRAAQMAQGQAAAHSQAAVRHSRVPQNRGQARPQAHSQSTHTRMRTDVPRPKARSQPQRPTGVHTRTQTDTYQPPHQRNSSHLDRPQPHTRMKSELPTPHFATEMTESYQRATPGLHSRTNSMLSTASTAWNTRTQDSVERGRGGRGNRTAPRQRHSDRPSRQQPRSTRRKPDHQRSFSESSTQSSYLPPLPVRGADGSLRPGNFRSPHSPSSSELPQSSRGSRRTASFIPRTDAGPRKRPRQSYGGSAHHRDLSYSETDRARATPHRRLDSSFETRTHERERSVSENGPGHRNTPSTTHRRRASGMKRSAQYSISRRPRAPKAVSADDLGRPKLKIARKRSTRSEPSRRGSSMSENRQQDRPMSPGFDEDFTLHGVGQTRRDSLDSNDTSGETPGKGGLRSRTEDLLLAAENERLRERLEAFERDALQKRRTERTNEQSKAAQLASENARLLRLLKDSNMETEDEIQNQKKDTQRLRLEMAAYRRKAVNEKRLKEQEEAARKEAERNAEAARKDKANITAAKKAAERRATVASERARREAAEAAERDRAGLEAAQRQRAELEVAKREAERNTEIARRERADLEAAKKRVEQKAEVAKLDAERRASIARKERVNLEAARRAAEQKAETARRERENLEVAKLETERKAAVQKAGLEAARRAAEKRAEMDAKKQSELAAELQRLKEAALENEMQYDEIAAELGITETEMDLQSESKRTQPAQDEPEKPKLGVLLPDHLRAAAWRGMPYTSGGTVSLDVPNDNGPDTMQELSSVFANLAKLRSKADAFQQNLKDVQTPVAGSEEKLLPKSVKVNDELAMFEATLDGFKTPGGHLLGRENSLARMDSLESFREDMLEAPKEK